jgi:hypothetical protein
VIADDYGASTAQGFQRRPRAREDEIEIDEFLLRMRDYATNRNSQSMTFDAQLLTGKPELWDGGCFSKRHRAPRPLSQRMHSRWNAAKVNGVMEEHHTLRVNAFHLDKTITTRVIDGNIGTDLWKMNRCLHPMHESMTNKDHGHSRKPNDRLTAGDRVMSMDNIWCFTQLAKVVDNRYSALADLVADAPERWRVYDWPMTTTQQPDGQVPNNHL